MFNFLESTKVEEVFQENNKINNQRNEINVSIYSTISLINDLNVLRKRPQVSSYNISFRIMSDSFQTSLPVKLGVHSYILIARSPWFRKAYIKFIHDKNYKHFEVNEFYANNLKIEKDSDCEKNTETCLKFKIENISYKVFTQFSKFHLSISV